MDDFGFLVPIAVLVTIIAAIVYGIRSVTKRRRDFPEADTGIGTVRRLYFYTISLVALLMFTSGIGLIVRFILEVIFVTDEFTRSGDEAFLAIGLALTIVGFPLWVFHWRVIGKQVRELPIETRSIVRKVYIYLLLGIAVVNIVMAADDILRWLFGGIQFEGSWWPTLVIWGGVWVFHWQLESREGQSTPETRAVRRIYLYLVSAAAMGAALTGIGSLIHVVLRDAYDGLANVSILTRDDLGGSSTKDALSSALVAAPLWAVHWLVFLRRDYESTLRQIYYYGYAILGGIAVVLIALGIMTYNFLAWVFGGFEQSAAIHFEFFPGTFASLVVGAGVLVYHSLVVNQESIDTGHTVSESPRGAFPYLLAFIGNITLASGITVLMYTAIGLLTEGSIRIVDSSQWSRQVALALTLGVFGLSLWLYYWRLVQSRLLPAGSDEYNSQGRRGFIFAALGIGMLALLGSVSFLAFVFFRELLDGNISAVLGNAKMGIALIVPAIIFVPYYWMVYQKDRLRSVGTGADESRKRKIVTVIVSRQGLLQLGDLESVLGYRVSPLEWTDEETASPELSRSALLDIVRHIDDAPGPNVILIPQVSTYRVLSYG